MQEPRAVAERRGDLESVAQLSAGGRQASIVVRRRRQVRHEGEIVARSNRGQESVELGGRDGGRWGLMAGEHVLRVLLALGDVGLVERIDAHDCPRDGESKQNTKDVRSEEHTSELQSRGHLVCRLLLEKKKQKS